MTRYDEQSSMRDWVVSKGYDAFCTLKFQNGYDISEQHAQRVVELFLQHVDRAFWGNRANKENLRCPRFVFLHKGTSGQNTHFHMVIQTIGLSSTFLQVLRSVWASFNETDPITSGFELARNTDATGTYCTHEWAKLGGKTFCDRLSYTNPITGIQAGKNIHKVRRLLKAIEG